MSIPKELANAINLILNPYARGFDINEALQNKGKKTIPIEQFYKITEVANRLSCSRRHIYNLIESGKLTASKGAGVTRIKESEILKLIRDEKK